MNLALLTYLSIRPIHWIILAAFFLIPSCASYVLAGSSERAFEKGKELAENVYYRADGQDASANAIMKLTEQGHSPRVRNMYMYEKDKKPGETWSLIRFTSPSTIDGTGLLTLDEPGNTSSQWVYLPALDRVRRIISSRKGGRFVGSDFYYEDLRDREVDMDRHRLIGNEVIDGVHCEVLESIPVENENSVYTKRIRWIDPKTLIAMRTDFYIDGDAPRKRLIVRRIEKIQGYETVVDSTMVDLVNGHRTRITVQAIVYDRGIPDALFTRRVLSDPVFETRYRP